MRMVNAEKLLRQLIIPKGIFLQAELHPLRLIQTRAVYQVGFSFPHIQSTKNFKLDFLLFF